MTVFDLKLIDVHTHLSGSESGENATNMLATMNSCGIEKAFIFAPLLDVHSWQLTDEHLDDVRIHNDYCANICSADPERLLGFAVLNPSPSLAGENMSKSVDLMVEECERCYRELGLRGVKMVPTNWEPHNPEMARLYRCIAELGMYTVFHSGIFLDGHEGSYCRPTFFECLHQVKGFKGHLAHLSWPWVDECIAVLSMEMKILGSDPKNWDLRADFSFGSPDDWQLSTLQKALDTLPGEMLMYGSDLFWPTAPDEYREKYLQPQLGLYETAATLGHLASEGSDKRTQMRKQLFYENAMSHWQGAVREPQRPKKSETKISTPRAKAGE